MNKHKVIAAQRRSWDTFSAGWKKWEAFLMEWFSSCATQMIADANIKDGTCVLDAATGTGEPGLTIARQFPSATVIGTDFSEEMVAIANERAAEEGLDNYTTQVAPTSKLPFDADTFDATLSRFGVIFAPDVAADIKELTRVLKPGGRMSLSSWAEPGDNPWATIVPKILQDVLDVAPPQPGVTPGIFRAPRADSLSSIMASIGLSEIEVADVEGEVVLDSPEVYWELLLDIAAPIAGPIKEAAKTTQEDIKARTLATLKPFTRDSGTVVLPYHARVSSGSKI